MSDAIDRTALGWIKPELDALLSQARLEVEAWAESHRDGSALQTCAQLLQQVASSLRMLELESTARLTDELRELAQALGQGDVPDTDRASAALMRGLVQMPDYLERLQGGHRDVPVALLPLFNEVRESRGDASLDASELSGLGDGEAASDAEIEHARAALSGRNRALLGTVSAAVKEDLMQVKDALDLHLRGNRGDVAGLGPHAASLGRIADTLNMIGLRQAGAGIARQREALQAIADGKQAANEDALLDIAGVLLHVDASLDDEVAHSGSAEDNTAEDMLGSESRRVTGVLLHEAGSNLSRVSDAITLALQSGWRAAELSDVPHLLQEVAGALRVLDQAHPADLLTGVQGYIRDSLSAASRAPDLRAQDRLADAITSLDMYLEAYGEGVQREDLLDTARVSLAQLGWWPLPTGAVHDAFEADRAEAAQAEAARDEAAQQPKPVEPVVDVPVVAEAAALPADAVPSAATATAVGFEQVGDEIDDEIREIFLEEFEEEIGNLDGLLPAWRNEPDNLELLRPIRRVFHTLKGSGRLVGARVLGEFSWKVENMLNRVLDGSRSASPAVIALVGQAHATLPQLHVALKEAGTVSADLAAIEDVAERLAAGEEARIVAKPVAEPVEAPVEQEAVEAAVAEAPEPGIPVSVDPVLLEILQSEVSGHLQTIDTWLDSSSVGSKASEVLLRALHTSNGAFAMAEVPAITDVLGPAEAYVRRLLAAESAVDATGLAVLGNVAKATRETLEALSGDDAYVVARPELVAEITSLRDRLPEPLALEPMEGDEDFVAYGLGTRVMPEVPQADEPVSTGSVESLLQGHVDMADAHAEAERLAVQRAEQEAQAAREAEAKLLEAERIEAERLAAEQAESERLAAEQAEAERLAAEQAEAERLAAEKAEAERVEAERLAAEKAEADRVAAEQAEAERLAAEKAEAERIEAERLAAEQVEAERLAAEKAEADRVAAEQAEAERLAAEKAEAERIEAERLAAEQAEAERLAAEKAEAERLAAERAEADRLEMERIAAEVAEAERLEAEHLAAEKAEAERLAAEQAEAERLEAERIAAEQAEAARLEAERIAAEEAEARRVADEKARAEREAQKQREEAARVAALLASAASAAAPEDPDEALDAADLDVELVDLFVEEAQDLLDHSDGLLASLRGDPGNRDHVTGLQRDLHTIKGGARMAGVMAVGELGHAMESLLEIVAAQQVELGSGDIPLLERGFDRLHGMVTRVGARRAIGLPEALIAEFNARASKDSKAELPKFELKPLSAPIGADFIADEDDIGVRAPQEQVRIRADLLDRLVNYAGEVAIYRARLEQQLGAFRSAMVEMEQTNTRLRDQLRRLDSETEAQIIARYQRENESGNETFDPLELDRFSTLQQLSRALAESAADMASLQGTLDDLTRQYETLLLQQSRVSSDLQEGLMRTRMVPFDALVPRLRRVVRQAAGDTGKQAQLRLEGTQGELDRNVLERMTAPLEHMLRNAVAHGLESPADRKSANKDEEGSIRVVMRREGSEVVLEVSDDGIGLDRDAIRRRAVERGLIQENAVLADGDLDTLILESGFSTADEVSRLAGRGVGMDVVASEVRQLGGSLDIASKRGEGTVFTLRLPQTLAVTQAVFVRVGETDFAVPIASVRGVGRISRDEMGKADASYRYGGEDYALHDLGSLIGHAPARAEGQVQMPLLLIRSGELRAAVAIDQVLGNREIVVKPVGPQVASIPGIFGATIMGDGRVVVILDVAPLVRRNATQPRDAGHASHAGMHDQGVRRVPLVMVVDDSVTMRKVTGRVLERHNYEVMTAKDGIDALERMDERIPDLMLLDIEMPRMDGYELATEMRSDPRLRDVPIIMITSRTGEKHRERAFEIGVQRYLGKPYQEPELMRNVFELLGTEPVHGNNEA